MGHGLDETHGKLGADLGCRGSEEYLFDVCGYGGHGGHGGLSVAMGLMRPTANGGPFLGCRGWMWQIGGLRKEIEASVCGYGGSVDEMRCDA